MRMPGRHFVDDRIRTPIEQPPAEQRRVLEQLVDVDPQACRQLVQRAGLRSRTIFAEHQLDRPIVESRPAGDVGDREPFLSHDTTEIFGEPIWRVGQFWPHFVGWHDEPFTLTNSEQKYSITPIESY